MMDLNLTFSLLTGIAAACHDGFTIDKNTMEPITAGYSVVVAGTQNSFGNYGAARVIAYANTHPEVNALGGWYNSENGQYYFDAVIICNTLAEALELAKANDQIAIFDLNNLQEIRL